MMWFFMVGCGLVLGSTVAHGLEEILHFIGGILFGCGLVGAEINREGLYPKDDADK